MGDQQSMWDRGIIQGEFNNNGILGPYQSEKKVCEFTRVMAKRTNWYKYKNRVERLKTDLQKLKSI